MENLKKLLKQQHSLYNNKKISIEKELLKLIKGTVTKRNIKGCIYYYLCHREGKKVENDYLGKLKPLDMIKQVEKRRKFEKELKEIKKALKCLEV